MSFAIDVPEDMGSTESAYLKVAGDYHVTITTVHEGTMPPDKDGNAKAITNGGFSMTAEVVHGEQSEKKFTLVFPNGNYNHKDHGVFSRKKQAAFCIACDLIKPGVAGQVEVNIQDAVGSQCVVELETEEYEDSQGKKQSRVQLKYAGIYHIDDPRVKKVEKNAKMVSTIPPDYRLDEKYFAPLTEKKEVKKEAKPQERVTDDDLDGL